MRRGPVIAEDRGLDAVLPGRDRAHDPAHAGLRAKTTEGRVDALLRWYPAPWRERHGETPDASCCATRSTTAAANLRMSLDVAREGVVERRRDVPLGPRVGGAAAHASAGSWWSRRASSPRSSGVRAPAAESWFVALYVDGGERWLVVGGMVAIGLLLLDRGDPARRRRSRGARRAASGSTRRIARAELVDPGREPVGELRVRDLQHVLGVLLARPREVERAEEHGVVGDRHLGVHVVVDARRAHTASSACPWNATRQRSSSGPFQRERGFSSHWRNTWATCVASQTPATSTRCSSITSASVPRIGPAVSSGVAIRTRRRAAPIRLAIRCESSGPRPGQNHGRMPSAGALSKLPESPDPPASPTAARSCA